jgi:hypothetical protein
MNTTLSQNADALAAIESNLVEKLSHEVMASLIQPQVEIIRSVRASMSSVCISANPTLILQSPCGTLFVRGTETDENDIITGFNLTCDPTKAEAFSMQWAKDSAHAFKNGQGSFTAVNEIIAQERVLESTVETLAGMINTIIEADQTQIKKFSDIQGNYFGEFHRLDNSGLAAFH